MVPSRFCSSTPLPTTPRPRDSDIPRSGTIRREGIFLARLTDNPVFVTVAKCLSFFFCFERSVIVVSTRDMDSKLFNGVVGEWPVPPGIDPAAEMHRLYLLICSKYSPNIQRSIVGVKGSLDAAHDIVSPACVDVRVASPFNYSIPLAPNIVPSPVYLRELGSWWLSRNRRDGDCCGWFAMRSCGHSHCEWLASQLDIEGSPLFFATRAFVSGGTDKGVVEALQRSARYQVKPVVPHEYFAAAYISTFVCLPTLKCPSLSPSVLRSYPYQKHQSAGFFPVKTDRDVYDDLIVKFVNTTKQDMAYSHSYKMLLEIVAEVKDGVQRSILSEAWFPVFVNKISVKPEVRGHGTDYSKTRVIFIACMVHLLLDKAIFTDYVKSTYQLSSIMLAHQWRGGGAEHLACKMGYARDDMFYVNLDIKHFDQSAFASIISLIVLMPFFSLSDKTEDYAALRAIYLQRAHEMACKLVKWEGLSYRLIVGQVFSGLYLTSWLDTVYMEVCKNVCLIAACDRMAKVDRVLADSFQSSFQPACQYGDNCCWGFEMKYLPYLCANRTDDYPLGDLQRDMEHMCGLACKASETFLFLPDETKISPFFTLITPILNGVDVVGYNIKRHGPEFLKRRFVRIVVDKEIHIVPWRHESDYYTKSCVSAHSLDTESVKWASKFLGLMVDTMGTNVVAFSAMRSMYVQVATKFGPVTSDTIYEHAVARDPEMKRRMIKVGILPEEVPKFVEHSVLLRQFLWDDNMRDAWSHRYKRPLYEPNGVEYWPEPSDDPSLRSYYDTVEECYDD